MAKVFTITQGLENMGALKTGGQGSVYKGRRVGEIITAIKILPTPIYSESADDKNFTAFENEVAKLKKVNEIPNPNVVKILSSGITDTGNFPFIEMEYIEGPDLEELLKPPHAPIFTIKETLKVAEQLANALAHCHKTDVRHGDIKSNNVKFNTATGNYILLDFGLAIMSDEQRRSSLRQAGAIEFMAPEQNTGQMLFQTDIYSFGVVLFELLAGTVPFELKNKGETARNEVRLAHMVSPIPDILQLRQQAIPLDWDRQKQDTEMQVPEWMLTMIYKCLEKKPQSRFENGMELYDYIVQKSISKPDNGKELHQIATLEQTNQSLLAARQELNKRLLLYQDELIKKEKELNELQSLLAAKEASLQSLQNNAARQKKVKNSSISKSAFTALWLVAFVFGAFTVFYFFKNNSSANTNATNGLHTGRDTNTLLAFPADISAENTKDEQYSMHKQQKEEHSVEENMKDENTADAGKGSQNDNNAESQNEEKKPSAIMPPAMGKKTDQNTQITEAENKTDKTTQASETETKSDGTPDESETENKKDKPTNENEEVAKKPEKPFEETADNAANKNGVTKDYLIISRAYFYNEPDENTRRDEFISPYEKAVVKAITERYGFIYVVITNPQGRVFKGWLRKRDLKLYSIE